MWLFFVFWIGKVEFIKWKKNNKKTKCIPRDGFKKNLSFYSYFCWFYYNF